MTDDEPADSSETSTLNRIASRKITPPTPTGLKGRLGFGTATDPLPRTDPADDHLTVTLWTDGDDLRVASDDGVTVQTPVLSALYSRSSLSLTLECDCDPSTPIDLDIRNLSCRSSLDLEVRVMAGGDAVDGCEVRLFANRTRQSIVYDQTIPFKPRPVTTAKRSYGWLDGNVIVAPTDHDGYVDLNVNYDPRRVESLLFKARSGVQN